MKFIPILFSTAMVQAILEDRKTMTRRTKGLELVNETPDRFRYCGNSDEIDVPRLAIPYDDRVYYQFELTNSNMVAYVVKCPYKTGDVLWVRENGQLAGWDFEDGEARIKYENGDIEEYFIGDDDSYNWTVKQFEKLRDSGILKLVECDDEEQERFEFSDKKQPLIPSIHMPKWTSRIFLKVKSVRVERLQDISEEDAKAEGVERWVDDRLKSNPTHYQIYSDFDNPDDPAFYSSTAVGSFESLWRLINGKDSWNENPWVWVIEFERIEKPLNFI